MPDDNELPINVIQIQELVSDLERLRRDPRYRQSTRQAAAKLIIYLGKMHSRMFADECRISARNGVKF